MYGGVSPTTRSPLPLWSFTIEYGVRASVDARINIYSSQSPCRWDGYSSQSLDRGLQEGSDFYQVLSPWEGGGSVLNVWIAGWIDYPNMAFGPGYSTYKGTLRVEYETPTLQHLWLTTGEGTIFSNVTLDRLSVTNTYLALLRGYSDPPPYPSAYFTHVIVRGYSSSEPVVGVGGSL